MSDHMTGHTAAMNLHHFWLCLRELDAYFKDCCCCFFNTYSKEINGGF